LRFLDIPNFLDLAGQAANLESGCIGEYSRKRALWHVGMAIAKTLPDDTSIVPEFFGAANTKG
jgi:hypothetical protein